MARLKHGRVAGRRRADGRRLEHDQASAGREMGSHREQCRAQRRWIEDVAAPSTPMTRSKCFAQRQRRDVPHLESAAPADTLRARAPGRLGDHGGAQVDARDPGAAAPRARGLQRPMPQPTSNTRVPGVTFSHGARARRCSEIDGPVVEFRHAVGTDRGEPTSLSPAKRRARSSPVDAGAVGARGRVCRAPSLHGLGALEVDVRPGRTFVVVLIPVAAPIIAARRNYRSPPSWATMCASA